MPKHMLSQRPPSRVLGARKSREFCQGLASKSREFCEGRRNPETWCTVETLNTSLRSWKLLLRV